MVVERRIRLKDIDYYLGFELKYGSDGMLEKLDNSYFDLGDISIMIKEFENSYDKDKEKYIYIKDNSYMNDIIYLYDRFPFISYIKDIIYAIDKTPSTIGYIKKDEILDYIKRFNIEINKWDKNSAICPLLYK